MLQGSTVPEGRCVTCYVWEGIAKPPQARQLEPCPHLKATAQTCEAWGELKQFSLCSPTYSIMTRAIITPPRYVRKRGK